MPKLYSWNVNGVRAIVKKGFLDWLAAEKPDVICLQEVKATPDVLTEDILSPPGYQSIWQPAQKKGYSGLATYYKKKFTPENVRTLGLDEFDAEGRVQVMDLDGFTLVNTYWPNSQAERARLEYKCGYCRALRKFCDVQRDKGRHVIICGDFNIAHKDIDLARPKTNRDSPGFYPEECAELDAFEAAGYVDIFRKFTSGPDHYTWWSYRSGARQKNIGWRIDYHWIDADFEGKVTEAKIHPHVMGSDHCPVSLTVK